MNKEAVKLYADLILEKSLVITPYESNNDISFKYEHNSIIATIIKKNMYNFKHEYDDFTILRDETYTSYYESLIKLITKEKYTYEQMDEIIDDFETQEQKITQTFIKLLIGYTNNLLKAHLIDHTRKDQSNNEHITTRTIYTTSIITCTTSAIAHGTLTLQQSRIINKVEIISSATRYIAVRLITGKLKNTSIFCLLLFEKKYKDAAAATHPTIINT